VGDDVAVLVVEDDPLTLRVFERTVRRVYAAGRVIEAVSVQEALAALQHERVTAIVTDFQLPDGDALPIILASQRQDPARPVLVISSTTSHASSALAAGATRFFAKPVDLAELITALNDLRPT
jgi:two-component system, NarL family, capsular synthesis sensor histidine kinase RcsC